jgi:hypothetical protein
MKTERRHELEKNQLADWLTSKITWCEENARLIAGVVAGIAIIGIVYFVLSNRKQEREAAAWNTFFTANVGPDTGALETLANNDGDLLAGQLADLRLADHNLAQGIDEMSKDRTAATEKITKSKDYYTRLEKSRNAWMQERAALGLARGYETLGMLDKAQEHYTKLRDFKDGLYHDFAVEKLKYLGRRQTQEFAEFYKNHKPRKLPGAGPLVDPSRFTMPNDATHSGLNLTPDTIFPAGTAAATTTTPAPASTATGDASRYAVPAATPSGTPAATPTGTPTATPTATPAATPATSATPAASTPAPSTTPTGTKPAASPSASASATPATTTPAATPK